MAHGVVEKGGDGAAQAPVACGGRPRGVEVDPQGLADGVAMGVDQLKPLMAMGVINYGPFHYRYASGREGDWYVVILANRKQYVSLYLCATVDGQYVAEANAARLGKVSVGKSCIRFKRLDDIDLDVVAELVRTSADAMAGSLVGG